LLNSDVEISIYTTASAVSPYMSVAWTVMLYGVASDETVPLRARVELSKVSQGGVCAETDTISELLAVWSSSSRFSARPSKLIISPAVALIVKSASLKASKCTPTSRSNFIVAPLNPSTSDAINCIPKVCGGCMREW
jgi:hypothetical protein